MLDTKFSQAVKAFLPLAITPIIFFLLASGYVDAGGGEKDIILVLPYFIWALIFFISALVLIRRGWSAYAWLKRSLLVSLGVMVGLWSLAFITSSLGIA